MDRARTERSRPVMAEKEVSMLLVRLVEENGFFEGHTYHHGWTCACAHRCGEGGSSCGRRRGADGYGWGGELEIR